ncbi:MAG: undecaprenyl/decaprenyl-phosphate alpha-N-acetylglucosaminyl 1-phosphate transferase [Clostridia bacterium]|nr:undecaprenyl/decaprenyl-phosphate alpha-N-acetylglucosaminyl 1-phosphate transferase [Clostridia bacterium]
MSDRLLWVLCGGGVALMSAALLPSSMAIAPYIGAVDVPREARRMHKRPIPRCGGIALFGAFWSILAVLGQLKNSLLPLLLATALLTVLGLADDVFGLPAGGKLLAQLVAGGIVIGVPTRSMLMPWLLALLWLCLVTNAHNMIDGIDGLAGSVIAAESAGTAVLLLLGGDALGGVLSLGCLGCCLGYLPYNMHPARVFMGDEGALFLGFLIGWLSLRAYDVTGAGAIPLLLCFIPMADLTFAVVRRLLHGKNPFRADRGHLHHRLCDAGLGQRQVCLCLAALSLIAALGAIAIG